MNNDELLSKCREYLEKLCVEIGDRSVGSPGNREAAVFFEEQISRLGWETETQPFDAVDWNGGGAELSAEDEQFRVLVSPYSLGFSGEGELAAVSSRKELEALNGAGKIILLYGEIAKEQLMPKSFVFYNPEEHQKTVAALEKSGAVALICATGRDGAAAAGVYPFPLIEDGDFDVPSVYMTEEEGGRLLPYNGTRVKLVSRSERIPGTGWNVAARRAGITGERIVVTAHIDAKKGTPGAIDNAAGAAILLLTAELLAGCDGRRTIEIVAFNGEDYFSVPGQMKYIELNQNRFDTISLNINIDGAGYREGGTEFSFYDVPDDVLSKARKVISRFPLIQEGKQWVQGDHSIFLHYGCPAIAVSSEWFIANIETQDITHTPKDSIEIVDCRRVTEAARALAELLRELGNG
jgi:aminopeptidase YwaD